MGNMIKYEICMIRTEHGQEQEREGILGIYSPSNTYM